MRRLHAMCFIALLLYPAAAFAAAPLHQWNPSESWPGRADADARLDQPVRFWHAGLPLKQVFAEIRQQTGVTLTFIPEGDQNERVRVHLFLNPQQPPTLRELMAQLSWAVDCGFAVTDTPDGKVYSLLSTSAPAGAAEEIAARIQQVLQRRENAYQRIDAAVAEYREALTLSPDEAIARYRGVNDRLLLNLLDPPRRAATTFLCRHATVTRPMERPGEHGGDLVGFGATVPSSAFAEEDMADLRTAFGLPESVLRDPQFSVDLYIEAAGRLRLNVGPEYASTAPHPAQGHYGPYLIVDATDEPVWTAEDELALRRVLGEDIPAGNEKERLHAVEADLAARHEARLRAGRDLSAEAEALLARTSLTLRDVVPDAPLAPWVVQEAVARATGKHVVSDGLLWSGRYFGLPERWSNDKESTLTALAALESFTDADMGTGLRRPSWEWGDAGTFLRFRTADRDLWRAAMVPQAFLDWTDSLLKSALPDQQTLAKKQHLELKIPVGLVYWTRMLGQLSDVQLRFGNEVMCDDPQDPTGIARHRAVGSLLHPAWLRPILTRLLASLRDDQWQQVKGEGLRVRTGLLPDQQQLLARAVGADVENIADRLLVLNSAALAGHQYQLDVSDLPGGRAAPEEPGSRMRIVLNGEMDYAPSLLRIEVSAPH
jgi:hypothetical protein